MNLIERRRLRKLRDGFYNAPFYIRKTRWYALTKALLDKMGDPGPEPGTEKYEAPEGCPFPELADGGEYCKDCQTPVEGCVGHEPPEEDPALATAGEEAERAEHEAKEQEEADREAELEHEEGGPPQ